MKTKLLVLVLLLLARPLFAQCPAFPARGVEIIEKLYDSRLAQGSDDDRRVLTKTFVEEFVFEFPFDGWTRKSADPGRPESKDSIARLVNGRLCNWDWQNGTTRLRSVQAGQIGDDITGQNPIGTAGVNHLGGAVVVVPPGQPPPIQPPAGVDIAELVRQITKDYDDKNEVRYLDLRAAAVMIQNSVGQVDTHLTQHDNEPSWLGKVAGFLRNPVVLSIIGTAAATWQANNMLTNNPKPVTP